MSKLLTASPIDLWREAKFGMIVHWGLYALPAGTWKGKETPYISEWIMKWCHITSGEYAQLAQAFNPQYFDASAMVALAKQAGMKYLIFTAKHHDGFAMYKSHVSGYNVVDATPWGRDPVAELAEACREQDMLLGLYYSQIQDWHDPNGYGNTWEFGPDEQKDLGAYIQAKVKPQLHELLTQYGPLGLIWFDTPMNCPEHISRDLAEFVRGIQPDILINGRIGNDVGDYHSLGDNQVPSMVLNRDWETIGTMNGSWGYKVSDNNWKDASLLTQIMVDIAGKGGNYALNIGPTAEGVIPSASVDILQEMGQWFAVNEESIRAAQPNPFGYEFDWGAITSKDDRLYLHFFASPSRHFSLNGLQSQVNKARFLAEPDIAVAIEQKTDAQTDITTTNLHFNALPQHHMVTTLALELDGPPVIDKRIIQREDRSIVLEAFQAQIKNAEGTPPRARLLDRGIITEWTSTDDHLEWSFEVTEPGDFDLHVISLIQRPREWLGEPEPRWLGGHHLCAILDGVEHPFVVQQGTHMQGPRSFYYRFMDSYGCRVTLNRPGAHTLVLRAHELFAEEHAEEFHEDNLSLKLRSVCLRKGNHI